MSDYTPETGDTVIVTLKPAKVVWCGKESIESDAWYIDLDEIGSITKVVEPLPTTVGSVVAWGGSGGDRYFLTHQGWVRENGTTVQNSMGDPSHYTILTLVE